ncbi:N2227-like protein-domain-containing protein [Tricharina praecox]|uniref:N2227-like protein-domain-containing protein n=1 Tax=Tricharina praecox TaxID=43433 RepID=UPI00221F2385|nr:N2227-like protein-domain-containing protein [Tricharina praecox]KAI5845426.1 N2227-like protein-domain-containing protein [Tricharina praecox]
MSSPLPPPPPPSAAPTEMLVQLPQQPQPHGSSTSTRISLLLACLVVVAALQYPMLVSYFQRLSQATVSSSTAAIADSSSGGIDRGKLLAALAGMSRYRAKTSVTWKKKRAEYNKLPASQKLLLGSTINYVSKISAVANAAAMNDVTAQAVLEHGLRYYGISPFELQSYAKIHRNVGDHSQVAQALKHFVRDWSTVGRHERDAIFPQILETLVDMFPAPRSGVRVLVPGAGLGRLSYDLAAAGFDVVANEFSPYMVLAQRYMLSLKSVKPNSLTFHPNLEWWSHHRSTESLLRAVQFPDIVPDAQVLTRLKLVEGDFVTRFLPHEHGAFDVVATLFFIDTARNLVDYLETIAKVLKPGGVWINLGPLLYGTAPLVELSLDEVLTVAAKLGFEFLPADEKWGEDTFATDEGWRGKVRGKLAGYSWDPNMLTRNAYLAQFWVARKVAP